MWCENKYYEISEHVRRTHELSRKHSHRSDMLILVMRKLGMWGALQILTVSGLRVWPRNQLMKLTPPASQLLVTTLPSSSSFSTLIRIA